MKSKICLMRYEGVVKAGLHIRHRAVLICGAPARRAHGPRVLQSSNARLHAQKRKPGWGVLRESWMVDRWLYSRGVVHKMVVSGSLGASTISTRAASAESTTSM